MNAESAVQLGPAIRMVREHGHVTLNGVQTSHPTHCIVCDCTPPHCTRRYPLHHSTRHATWHLPADKTPSCTAVWRRVRTVTDKQLGTRALIEGSLCFESCLSSALATPAAGAPVRTHRRRLVRLATRALDWLREQGASLANDCEQAANHLEHLLLLGELLFGEAAAHPLTLQDPGAPRRSRMPANLVDAQAAAQTRSPSPGGAPGRHTGLFRLRAFLREGSNAPTCKFCARCLNLCRKD